MGRTVLYFGSFNPIHRGHIAIAEYILDQGEAEEIWLVVSPHNPLKSANELAPEEDRLHMARLAVAASRYPETIRPTDVEFTLPRPSYTIDTLRALSLRYPARDFVLLIGADNALTIDRWKESETLLRDYAVWVYPRRGFPPPQADARFRWLNEAPLFDYTATEIRHSLQRGQCPEGCLADAVLAYICKSGLYGYPGR